jgi:hypothetical protein
MLTPYRHARRSFLRGIGAGAVGLKILLRNLEAGARGAAPPPRFLLAHWPVGTIRYLFLPGLDPSYRLSRILEPFANAGLGGDMSVLFGLSTAVYLGGGGGPHESGTVKTTTGAAVPGVRKNDGESDDAVAGGPSFDQIFLRHVPELQRSGVGYVNAICDARVDSFETSTQCLSYGYQRQTIAAANGGTVTGNLPLMPTLRPLDLYHALFAGFLPGGASEPDPERLRRNLRARKSVLDHSLRQLNRIKRMAPASESARLDAHAEAIRKMEQQIAGAIAMGVPGCGPPPMPDPLLTGKTGSRFDYGNPLAATADDSMHEQTGKAHMAIIRAAFQCDLIRVATFQWAPGTNHVSFRGLYPGRPDDAFMHHPTSHRITDRSDTQSALPPEGQRREVIEFLANVQTWYNQKMADILVDLKSATDVFGGRLLDSTIVPFVTEVAESTGSQSPMPALVFGGSRLGMRGGQVMSFPSARPHNDLWMTIAQAYLRTTDPVAALPGEVFVNTGTAPIAGLWAPPP